MAKYQVDWCAIKKEGNTNGKPWTIMEMTLKSEDGTIIDKVSTFDPVQPGHTIEGTIEEGKYGKSFKKKLEAPQFIKEQRAANVEKAMERKEQSIEKFQTSKEESIALAGAQRDAVIIVNMLHNSTGMIRSSDETIKEELIKWRNWFLSTEFKNVPPF